MAELPDPLGIRAHGIELELRADSLELLAHVATLVPGMVGAPACAPEIEVRAHWIEQPVPREHAWFPDGPRSALPGRGLWVGEDDLLWTRMPRDRDLQLRFRRRHDHFLFDVACRYFPSPKKLAEYPDLRRKRFFDLLRYLVHFPIVWRLERERGWTLVHASAVTRGGRAVLLAGIGGAGKTTTCLALAGRAGMELLSENQLLCDGAAVYPVEEPIRLGEEALALLGTEQLGLEALPIAGGLKHKRMFRLRRASARQRARVEAIFFPRFSERGYIRQIDPQQACERLEAAHRLTPELSDYAAYAAALELLWPHPGTARARLAVLAGLTATAACFELGIDRSAGIAPVVEGIVAALDSGADEVRA